LLAIQLTQPIELEIAVFEVISALGTVGLSLGGTQMLDPIGKILVMACMFAGRVGPLTLFLFVTEQRHASPMAYPEEEVSVG
jgi:trk system potassium uptake protein